MARQKVQDDRPQGGINIFINLSHHMQSALNVAPKYAPLLSCPAVSIGIALTLCMILQGQKENIIFRLNSIIELL